MHQNLYSVFERGFLNELNRHGVKCAYTPFAESPKLGDGLDTSFNSPSPFEGFKDKGQQSYFNTGYDTGGEAIESHLEQNASHKIPSIDLKQVERNLARSGGQTPFYGRDELSWQDQLGELSGDAWNYIKENPWLQYLLAGVLGIGGGYALGRTLF